MEVGMDYAEDTGRLELFTAVAGDLGGIWIGVEDVLPPEDQDHGTSVLGKRAELFLAFPRGRFGLLVAGDVLERNSQAVVEWIEVNLEPDPTRIRAHLEICRHSGGHRPFQ